MMRTLLLCDQKVKLGQTQNITRSGVEFPNIKSTFLQFVVVITGQTGFLKIQLNHQKLISSKIHRVGVFLVKERQNTGQISANSKVVIQQERQNQKKECRRALERILKSKGTWNKARNQKEWTFVYIETVLYYR